MMETVGGDFEARLKRLSDPLKTSCVLVISVNVYFRGY